jgi:hypothetical protein
VAVLILLSPALAFLMVIAVEMLVDLLKARAPIGALPRPAGDGSTGRSRPQSQGGSQPPRSNGQALDVARKRVNVPLHTLVSRGQACRNAVERCPLVNKADALAEIMRL